MLNKYFVLNILFLHLVKNRKNNVASFITIILLELQLTHLVVVWLWEAVRQLSDAICFYNKTGSSTADFIIVRSNWENGLI